MGNIFSDMTRSYALENAICIKDIRTERDKKRAEKDGYAVGFTRASWNKQYPTIPAKYVFCRKSEGVFGPSSLIYYDKEHYVCFELQIYNGLNMDILDTLNHGKERAVSFEERVSEQVKKMMKLYEDKEWKRLLMPNYSEASGLLVMSLVKDILHHEEPSGDIYELFIDLYSMCDAGSSIISPEDMERLMLCKTEDQKIVTMEALKDLPEELTVYRGSGSESTDYRKAYSWTTDLNIAYFFASWRDASESKIYKGKVKKEDVIEYLTDRMEFEVIVSPESVRDIEIMSCVEWADFVNTIVSTELPFDDEYNDEEHTLQAISGDVDNIYRNIRGLRDHDQKHPKRVAMMSSYLYRKLACGREESAEKLRGVYHSLIEAAKWHDTGRINDSIEEGHGLVSTRLYTHEVGENAVATFLMEYHCLDDENAKEYLNKNFEEADRPVIWLAFQILKDADALDRWRFGRMSDDFVDVKYLRLELSKSLMPVAAYLQKCVD